MIGKGKALCFWVLQMMVFLGTVLFAFAAGKVSEYHGGWSAALALVALGLLYHRHKSSFTEGKRAQRRRFVKLRNCFENWRMKHFQWLSRRKRRTRVRPETS